MAAKKKKGSLLRSVLNQRPQFTPEVFKRLWEQNLTIQELAEFFSVSDETIRVTADKLKFVKKRVQQKKLSMEWQPGDPTLEEIAERAALIRAGWSDAETIRRLGGQPNAKVELRCFAYNPQTLNFSYTEKLSYAG